MPTVYQHPGVYVNEVSSGVKPIEGVGTSTAAFIGFAPAGPANKPTRVTSWLEFARTFGDPDPFAKTGPYLQHAYLAHAVNGFFANGGGACYIVRLGTDDYGGVPQVSLSNAADHDPELFKFVRRIVKRKADGTLELDLEHKPQDIGHPDPTTDMKKASEITVQIMPDPVVSPADAAAADAAAKLLAAKAAEKDATTKRAAADDAQKEAGTKELSDDQQAAVAAADAADAAAAKTKRDAALAKTASDLAAAKAAAELARAQKALDAARQKTKDAQDAAAEAVAEAAVKATVATETATAADAAPGTRGDAVTAAEADGVSAEAKATAEKAIADADAAPAVAAAALAAKAAADAAVIKTQAAAVLAEEEEKALNDKLSESLPTFTVTVSDDAGGDAGGPAYTQIYPNLTMAPGPKYIATVINNDPKRLVDVKELARALPLEQRGLTLTEPASLDLAQLAAPDLAAVPSEGPEDLKGDAVHGTGLLGLDGIDEITMVCVPDLMAIQPTEPQIRDVHDKINTFCSTGPIKRMAILDPPPGLTKADIAAWRKAAPASNFAVLYWPWIEVMDPFTSKPMMIPPCGHMAGVWAGTDNDRGVHKAPANVAVKAAIGVAAEITDGDQDALNPTGINCIRTFPGSGIRVWGARTLSADPEWRYINVRRLFNYVTASILKGTQWAVFEPNDEFLWSTLRVGIGNFLLGMWRQGAFFGATPQEAFFVKCDHETNPQDLIDAGQVNMHIGIAPVKPAEFVIFQIAQYTAQA